MKYGISELKQYINCYRSGKLEKEELGQWAERAYIDLLKGGYVEWDKIVIYPFLKNISQIHIEKDDIKDVWPCSDDVVQEIQTIVNGEKDFDFQIEIAIPIMSQKMGEKWEIDQEKIKRFRELYDCISEYINEANQDINIIGCRICRILDFDIIGQKDTIFQYLENHIMLLSKALFEIEATEIKKMNMTLYAEQMKRNLSLCKLLEYLECYLGMKTFSIVVSYRKGLPETLLLV